MLSSSAILNLLGATAPVRQPAELSETELASRYPLLGIVFGTLFLAGLVTNVALLVHWAQHKTSPHRFFRVTPKPWTIVEAVLAAVAFFAGSFATGLILCLVTRSTDLARPGVLLAELALRSAWLFLLWAVLERRQTDWRAAFGLNEQRPRALAAGGMLYLAMLPALIVVAIVYERFLRAAGVNITVQPITELFIKTPSQFTVGLLTVFAVVIAPVFEEVLFRGLAYPAIKQRFGTTAALLVVSILFAAMHQHLATAGPLFALGLGLALAYEYTGSLLTAVAVHSLFNATNIFMLLYVRANP